MGTMTLEQAARREKRRAKEAPRRAARAAAYTALILAAGGSVSGHTRMKLAAWEADPARDVGAFNRAKVEIQCRWHGIYSRAAKHAVSSILLRETTAERLGALRWP